MNKGFLNIYECNGVGRLSDFGIYKYWTAGTVDYMNTIAFNEQLAVVNDLMADYEILAATPEQLTETANKIDLHITILQALLWNTEDPDKFPIGKLGRVINKMNDDGLFDNSFVDDSARADNLENLLQLFLDRIEADVVSVAETSDFLDYWNERVVAQNENRMPDEVKQRMNDWFATHGSGAVGDIFDDVKNLDPKDFNSMSDYLKASGTAFLYLWIPENEIGKYSATIRYRYRLEKKLFDHIVANCGGIYSEYDVMLKMRCGIKEELKRTPTDALADFFAKGDKRVYLKDGGVRDPATAMATATAVFKLIAAIVSALAVIIGAIITCIQQCAKAKYDTSINTEDQIPHVGDAGHPGASENTEGGSKWMWALGAVAAFLFLRNNNE